MVRRAVALLTLAVALTSSAGAQRAAIPDSALVRLLAPLIASSNGGGTRADMRYLASDSATYRLFQQWGPANHLVLGPPVTGRPICPASTDAKEQPVQDPTSYATSYALTPADSGRLRLSVEVSCDFIWRGERGRPRSRHVQGITVEIARVDGAWRVIRVLEYRVT